MTTTPRGVTTRKPEPGFLQRIAGDRRRRIEEAKLRTPAHVLRSRLGPALPAGRLERPLRRGRAAEPLRLVCVVKRASPSAVVLIAEIVPVATARLYESGGASAFSLVTALYHYLFPS